MKPSGPRPEDFLYRLLPTVYRQRDLERGEPMRAIFAIAQHVYQLVENDIASLYDDWFVETCAPWVLPYLADLVAIQPALSADRPAVDLRRLVANVVDYRRRKGTPGALAEIARDVSGWAIHVVDPERTLARTPFAGIPALGPGAADVRRLAALDDVGGPFDVLARTVDVRAIGIGPGGRRHNIGEAAVFFWRDVPMTLAGVVPAAAGAGPLGATRWRFDPLGRDLPLIDPTIDPTAGPAERSVPARLSNVRLRDDVNPQHAHSVYFGREPSAFTIDVVDERTGARRMVTPSELQFTDLRLWQTDPPPPAGRVLVDVERGRFVLPAGWSDPLITATWGVTGNVGGGTYGAGDASTPDVDVVVARNDLQGSRRSFNTLDDALDFIGTAPALAARITLADSATYDAPTRTIASGPLAWKSIRIVTVPGERPVVNGDLALAAGPGARIDLDGFVLDGTLRLDVQKDAADVRISVANATIVPARNRPAIRVRERGADVLLTLQQSICGPIRMPQLGVRLHASESIVDGQGRRAVAVDDDGEAVVTSVALDACTVFGDVSAVAAEVVDSIITGALTVVGNDDSSIRTSALASSTGVTQVYRLASPAVPRFVSRSFARPGYARLSLDNPTQILAGAAGGGELGAFRAVADGRRKENLAAVIEEYVPYGIRPGVFDEG